MIEKKLKLMKNWGKNKKLIQQSKTWREEEEKRIKNAKI